MSLRQHSWLDNSFWKYKTFKKQAYSRALTFCSALTTKLRYSWQLYTKRFPFVIPTGFCRASTLRWIFNNASAEQAGNRVELACLISQFKTGTVCWDYSSQLRNHRRRSPSIDHHLKRPWGLSSLKSSTQSNKSFNKSLIALLFSFAASTQKIETLAS